MDENSNTTNNQTQPEGTIPESVMLDVPYIKGSFGNCGIACASMIANYNHAEIIPDEEYWETIKNDLNYVKGVGWTHQFLVNYINENINIGAELHKDKDINFVISELANGKPVEVSINVPTPDNMSQEHPYEPMVEGNLVPHLALCVGYDSEHIIINDPRDIGIYAENLMISKSKFQEIFTGVCIS